ncbi:MAG: response regulator transcription factor [Candidatus Nanopelagicales bacterium]
MKPLVMVVDDELGVRELIGDALRLGGYDAIEAVDGQEALQILRHTQPDLMIVDVNMPVMNGFELLEKIRDRGLQTPVIMLSARGDRIDVTHGLQLGADDYVRKPFGLEELLLRVTAVLRRSSNAEEPATVLKCGPVELDARVHRVKRDGTLIEMSPTEFRLLEYLLQHQARVVTRSELLRQVWGIDFETDTSVVDTYISYLRRKLHDDTFAGIKTIRGVGFQIEAE